MTSCLRASASPQANAIHEIDDRAEARRAERRLRVAHDYAAVQQRRLGGKHFLELVGQIAVAHCPSARFNSRDSENGSAVEGLASVVPEHARMQADESERPLFGEGRIRHHRGETAPALWRSVFVAVYDSAVIDWGDDADAARAERVIGEAVFVGAILSDPEAEARADEEAEYEGHREAERPTISSSGFGWGCIRER
jgi:hypothetical protein